MYPGRGRAERIRLVPARFSSSFAHAMLTPLRLGALTGLLALAAAPSAQPFATPSQEAPAIVTDLARRGAGGVVAALPTLDSPFFANPAHISTEDGFSLNVLGLTLGAGGNVNESWQFYDDELGPAIEEGLDEIRRDDPERLDSLYREALRIGGTPKTVDLAVLAPSLRMGIGPASIGIGVYGQSTTRALLRDGGAGIPAVDLYSQADLIVPAVVGADLSKTPLGLAMPFGLHVGARATFLQRRVTAKAKPIDAIDPDNEKLYVLRANAVRLALGAMATDVVIPGLDAGLELSNLGRTLDYEFETGLDVSSDSGFLNEEDLTAAERAQAATLESRFDDRQSEPVVRIGAAFRLPTAMLPAVSKAAVGLDYTSASTSSLGQNAEATSVLDQSMAAGLRLGARATLARYVDLQLGISQGMPSAGIGLHTKVVRLEYATYGVEDGRLLGQLPRRNHVVRLRFGWF